MPKWEYLTWGTDDAFGYSGARLNNVNGDDVDDDRSIYDAFDEIGRDGWELVSTTKTEYRVIFMFKRQVPEG